MQAEKYKIETRVEKSDKHVPVRIGIGLEDDEPALYAAGVEWVCPPVETRDMIAKRAFRPGDTIVVLRPASLRETTYAELDRVSEGKGLFEVVGHETVPLKTAAEIAEFRSLKAVPSRTMPVMNGKGRPNKFPYTLEEAEAILRRYYQPDHLDDVVAFANKLLRQEPGTIKPYWVKMLARKYTGNAKRTPPEGWDGILVDADGKPVHAGKN